MLIVLLYFYLKVNLFDDIFHLISELLMSLSLNGIVIGLFIAASEDLEKFYEMACKVAAVSLILMALAHGIFRFSMAKGN
ncbi:hypothetical protein [Arcobacter sp. L]|uniref:hypothetical protein n=1 Tax=Arcobacter sp. L TaxID=944547 RepID=UPI00130545E5|nr:hypothetical protein [Arcobacter sp. L]